MGSVGARTLAGVKLPTIKLDTTLAELYKRALPKNDNSRIAWVSCGTSSGVDLTPDVPRNAKYIYEEQVFVTASRNDLKNGNAALQASLAKKYLSHIPQRDAFITGNAPAVFFNLSQTPEQVEHDRREAEETISVLDPSQRPNLIFCPGPAKIPMKEHGIDKLQYKVILDGLEGYPLTQDLEVHWLLNSKAGLARSGLPTPKSDIIETEGCAPPAHSCCNFCSEAAKDTSHLPTIPSECTGPRGQWLSSQMDRILSAVRSRPVPFVFKTQQAFGGAGTWLITSPSQKSQLLADLSGSSSSSSGGTTSDKKHKGDDDGLLRRLLSLLTPANAHLSPTAVLLTDIVRDPIGDYGLTFIVTATGEPLFLAAAEQMLTADGTCAWVGSTIHYARQDGLRRRFAALMEQITAWVARHGYVGPVGADVLEARDGGSCYVVDLNVRTCGSLSLPLLRGHFVSRGLGCASSFSITVKGGRREFVEKWRGPFEEGRMLILSWYEDRATGESIADVVVGGEDEERLMELMTRVRESTEEVTF
ncbi:hypothetical protein VTI74DRAFT_3093 [Chaetomium olivicolor]